MIFNQQKVSGLSGETEVRFTEEPNQVEKPFPPLVVTATKRGVVLSGTSTYLGEMQDLQEFAGVISRAWEEHKKLLRGQIQIVSEMP